MIESFEPMVQAHQKENPSRLINEVNDGKSKLKIVTEQTPVGFALAVGEILHNMRGALDHLATAIVFAVNEVPDRRVNFPVHETKEQWMQMATRDKPHQLAKAAPDIWKVLEETVQPWKENDLGSSIWTISRLNNIDKHRLLIILPFKANAAVNADGVNSGIHMRHNLFTFKGWGEWTFFEGPALRLLGDKVYTELVIEEEDVLSETPLLPFLKTAYNEIFGLVYALETHLFGNDEDSESA